MESQQSQDSAFAPVPDRANHTKDHFLVAVGRLLEEEADSDLRPTAQFGRCLSEVAYQWTTTTLREDLDAFRQHAKRRSVGPDDVVLAARKNPVTHALLQREAARLRASKQKR